MDTEKLTFMLFTNLVNRRKIVNKFCEHVNIL